MLRDHFTGKGVRIMITNLTMEMSEQLEALSVQEKISALEALTAAIGETAKIQAKAYEEIMEVMPSVEDVLANPETVDLTGIIINLDCLSLALTNAKPIIKAKTRMSKEEAYGKKVMAQQIVLARRELKLGAGSKTKEFWNKIEPLLAKKEKQAKRDVEAKRQKIADNAKRRARAKK